MATPRKPTLPTARAIDDFCAQFDSLFNRHAARTALRQYLIGLLLPREHNKALTVLAALVPGSKRQSLHHFLHDAPWDVKALNRQRLALWQAQPTLAPHAGGVLIVDETGDRKRGHGIELAANQYLGKLGHTANGVVSVTSQWTDGTRSMPLGVRPYWPASRLPAGKKDPRFRTKPELAWALIEEARALEIPFRLVVADCIYGENPLLEERLCRAEIPYIMAIRPSHGTWQLVEDEANPPAFTPHDAALRHPLEQWQRTVRRDSHGKELVRYVAELALPPYYGPDRPVRLVAASEDPARLKSESTWYMTTSLPLEEASTAQVYDLYRLRDWIEHFYKLAKHELGWADFQVRPAQAIVRHWHLVMLAYTFSLLVGAQQTPPPAPSPQTGGGGKIAAASGLAGHLAPGTDLAVPMGSPAHLLAAMVDGATACRTGRPDRARRPVPATRRPAVNAPGGEDRSPRPDGANRRGTGPGRPTATASAASLRGRSASRRAGDLLSSRLQPQVAAYLPAQSRRHGLRHHGALRCPHAYRCRRTRPFRAQSRPGQGAPCARLARPRLPLLRRTRGKRRSDA
jgi:SRSO17 transposase